MKQPIALTGHHLTLQQSLAISNGALVKLDPSSESAILAGRQIVAHLAKSPSPIYGVNTGFGYFANQPIPQSEQLLLQKNILLSHAAGHGNPLPPSETRLAMALRLNVLAKGYTGVRLELCQALLNMLNAAIYPIIPEYGSVGASGDLAPLAHLALPLIGEGEVLYQGKVMAAREALKAAGLTPLILAEKEGLGLINGTQIMLAVGGLGLARGLSLVEKADLITALSFEGLVGNPTSLHPFIHATRGQHGQILSAQVILQHLEGSSLLEATTSFPRVQDPYSLRCAPQIHGPSRDALAHSQRIIEIELNAATDNPLVCPETESILSGGNFHGQPLALAFDIASIALSELANVSERRLELLLNPHSSGLPAFLSARPGLQSGYMALQYLAASLVNENKLLANPSCTDSIPGNVGIEDHVSMGMTSARKLKKIAAHVETVLAIEWLAAAQAIDLRKSGHLGEGTQRAYERLRTRVPPLTEDRILALDIEAAKHLIGEL